MRARARQQRTNLQAGRTIVAERERAETDSERMQARKKARKVKNTQVMLGVLLIAVLGIIIMIGVSSAAKQREVALLESNAYILHAPIIDEDNRSQVSSRIKNYAALLEQALANYGLMVTRFTLPTNMSHALYVDIEGRDEFYKVTVERGAGATAEDIQRMIKYLEGNDVHPNYVDVRLEGKAYYK